MIENNSPWNGITHDSLMGFSRAFPHVVSVATMRGSYCTTRKNATCTSSAVRDSPWPAVSTSKMLSFPRQCSLFSQRSWLVWPEWAFPIYLWLKASNTLYHSLPIIQSYPHRAGVFSWGRGGDFVLFCLPFSSCLLFLLFDNNFWKLLSVLTSTPGDMEDNYWPIVQI